MAIEEILCFMGSNEVVLGIASICGIAGFILTVIVSIRTAKIGKILKYNQIASQYNRDRKAYQNVFEGHQASIFEDNIRSDKLLKTILKDVEAYQFQFHEILSVRERVTLLLLKHFLKKESKCANYNTIGNYLAFLAGRLSKKEEKKNG